VLFPVGVEGYQPYSVWIWGKDLHKTTMLRVGINLDICCSYTIAELAKLKSEGCFIRDPEN
jgi:hypothetical protein